MSQPLLRCALFGVGNFGKNYLRLLQSLEGFALLSVVTTREHPELKSLISSPIRYTLNPSEVFASPDIDAVIIATPAHTHFALAHAALRAGKHVLVEKPMVMSTKEARLLARTASRSGKICMVGYQYIYNDAIRFLKTELDAGRLGTITHVMSEHLVSPPRTDINCFWDAAPHPLSVFNYLFNPGKIRSVSGKKFRIQNGSHEDFVSATVAFDHGPLLTITTSWLGPEKVRKFVCLGDTTKIILDTGVVPNTLTIASPTPIAIPSFTTEPLKNELEHFRACIENRLSPLTDVAFGATVTAHLETISKSL
jgi:predicted dehydrogenase